MTDEKNWPETVLSLILGRDGYNKFISLVWVPSTMLPNPDWYRTFSARRWEDLPLSTGTHDPIQMTFYVVRLLDHDTFGWKERGKCISFLIYDLSWTLQMTLWVGEPDNCKQAQWQSCRKGWKNHYIHKIDHNTSHRDNIGRFSISHSNNLPRS
jgi:hypothetical protein